MIRVCRSGMLMAAVCVLGIAAYAQQQPDAVVIGDQVWAARNLEVVTFRNGDPIAEVKSELEWKRADRNKQPAWCYYQNDSRNGEQFGKLYNWYAVSDERGLAPEGWHIPNKPELSELAEHLDGHFINEILADTLVAGEPPVTNEDTFHGLQGGYRLANGSFLSVGQYGYWWGTTCYLSSQSWLKKIKTGSGFNVHSLFHHGDGFSVRCIRDN